MILRFRMLVTFSKAVARTLRVLLRRAWKNDPAPILVDREVQAERESTCRTRCPHIQGDQCSICACFVSAKTWLSTETCPDERWER